MGACATGRGRNETMTERTFTVEEVRDTLSNTGLTTQRIAEIMEKLTRPKPPVIPEGVWCGGWDSTRCKWMPCRSDGDGTAHDANGSIYYTIRLTHPDDWAKAPQWAWSRVITVVGSIGWSSMEPEEALAYADDIYAEGRPE
jgi:hypothetical protein